ncbi:MAG: class I SAM-dependent methyltransferase [Anaerolineae bacterium]|nr:class I SAM-dependent methyltransferase [Anaerolineae bacterium]
MTDDILQEQIAYYRARSGEYDDWFYRLNRYDHGEELNRLWFDEVLVVRETLHTLGPVENALELASGTGIWTQELAALASHVTALDASPEMIAINRAKLSAPNVEYRQVDLFEWQPDREYDLVSFSFWISHVPPERLAGFLATVYRAVRPGGRVFMVDSRMEPNSSAVDTPLRDDEHIYRTRRLSDGSTYTIVKVFYEPDELREALTTAGFKLDVRVTDHYFIYAIGTKE